MNRFLRLLFIFITISFSIMLINVPAWSIDEYDLLQEGYNLYLSCELAKASERFRIFLREFPNSSAKDTALFWLGKALIQMGELEESEKVFRELRRDFPDGIFASYALKEMERMKALIANREFKKEGHVDKEIEAIRADRDRLASLLEEGRKKIEACEGRIREIDGLVKDKVALEERLKEVEKEKLIELSRIKGERDGLIAEIKKAREEITRLGKIKGDQEALLKERDKEIEGLRVKIGSLEKNVGELISAKERAEKATLEAKIRIEGMEKRPPLEIDKLRGDKERLQSLLSEEKKRVEGLSSKITALQEREKELLRLNASLKNIMESRISDVGSRLQTCERNLSEMKTEKDEKELSIQGMNATIKKLESEITRLKGFEIEAKRLEDRLNETLRFEKMVLELKKRLQDKERYSAELMAQLKEKEDVLSRLKSEKSEIEKHMAEIKNKIKERERSVMIGKERFSRDYISSYMFRSQILFGKLGIRDIPWRSGDLYNDFINEQVLYDEAKSIKNKDHGDIKDLRLLNKEEIEYLNRFTHISDFLNQELKKLSPEIYAEAILLPYPEVNKYENLAKVVNIQNKVKSGVFIGEIVKLYPEAEHRTLSENGIQELLGNLSKRFSDGDVVSTFNNERFMVLQIRAKPLEYRPFDPNPQIGDKRLREYISKWILTLRAKRDIKISD